MTRFDFTPPAPLVAERFHLEVLAPVHNERDYEAWTSSVEHIRATPGFANRSWPHAMTLEENLADMQMHLAEYGEQTGFTYSILDGDEVIGCIYIYPPTEPAHLDATWRMWVRASRSEQDAAIRAELGQWLVSDAWPFDQVCYPL